MKTFKQFLDEDKPETFLKNAMTAIRLHDGKIISGGRQTGIEGHTKAIKLAYKYLFPKEAKEDPYKLGSHYEKFNKSFYGSRKYGERGWHPAGKPHIFISTDEARKWDNLKEEDEYAKALKKEYDIDLSQFKDKIKGGKADTKPITKYPLDQILQGIKVEKEHTKDNMAALEITKDHLEEDPHYYTKLKKVHKD